MRCAEHAKHRGGEKLSELHLAFSGALVASGTGAALAGALLGQLLMQNALVGLIWGPLIVAMNLVMNPLVTLIWAVPPVALHLSLRRWPTP